MTTLPDAVQREHEKHLAQAAAFLREAGYKDLHVTGLGDYPDAPKLLIPVLNIHIQPDIYAQGQDGQASVAAFVPTATCLGDDSCGERWQEVKHWADDHHGQVLVFVPADHHDRAAGIAQKWKLDPGMVRVLG
ncbi:MAG: hypothetical protein ACOY4L_10825 [Pseudomonadota bacterium]